MSYCSASDIYSYEIYGLTSSDVNTATVTQFITDSEALIDSYIGGLYATPLVDIPNIIKKLARDITGYETLSYLYSQQNRNVDEWIENTYDKSIKQLEMIANGDLKLIHSGTVISTLETPVIAATYTDTGAYFNHRYDELTPAPMPSDYVVI